MQLARALPIPILLLGLAACADDGAPNSVDPGPAPTSLRDVSIAPDFTFAMTRPVTIRVKLGGSAGAAPVEVRNVRGELLAQGRIAAGKPYQLDYPLPKADTAVVIKVADKQQHVKVHAGVAEATFN